MFSISNATLFLFSNRIMAINAGIHMLARIANREALDQMVSPDLALSCFSKPFWHATSVRTLVLQSS